MWRNDNALPGGMSSMSVITNRPGQVPASGRGAS
jgi:hypothetical protein